MLYILAFYATYIYAIESTITLIITSVIFLFEQQYCIVYTIFFYVGKGHNATFTLAEAELRKKYPNHIIPSAHTEWLFINAGGWMGAMYLLHASVTEYVLFFGTAIHTSGHSGTWYNRYSN